MARKYVSTKKYNYDEGSRKKKIILIVVAVLLVLILAAVAAVFFLLRGGEEPPKEPTFEIASAPDNITYYVGDFPVWTGLEMLLTTAEGNSVTLKPDNCNITGFDSSAPAKNQVITVTYKEYSATFTINILDPSERPAAGMFTSLSFKTKPKTQYKVGESLSVEGGVLIKHYDSGETREMKLTSDMVYSFDSSKPGTYKLTIHHMEDAELATLTYDITVTN